MVGLLMDIAIIGGADGPTAIFLSSKIVNTQSLIIGAVIVIAVTGLVVWKRKRHAK